MLSDTTDLDTHCLTAQPCYTWLNETIDLDTNYATLQLSKP